MVLNEAGFCRGRQQQLQQRKQQQQVQNRGGRQEYEVSNTVDYCNHYHHQYNHHRYHRSYKCNYRHQQNTYHKNIQYDNEQKQQQHQHLSENPGQHYKEHYQNSTHTTTTNNNNNNDYYNNNTNNNVQDHTYHYKQQCRKQSYAVPTLYSPPQQQYDAMSPPLTTDRRLFKGFPFTGLSLFMSFLLFCSCLLSSTQGFLHNRISYEDDLMEDDLTHQDITEIGVTRAAGFYLGASPEKLPNINSTDPSGWFEDNFKRVANPDNFWNAIQDIVKHRELYNRRWKSDALKNMNGERINEGSLELLILKNTLLASLKYASVYSSLRVYVAQALHLLQSFYSNTNWVEMHGDAISEDLGMEDREFYVADQYQDTCKNCSIIGTCRDNIIVRNILTSGYRNGQATRKPRWNRPVYWNGKKISVQKDPSKGKCSHGGKYDDSRQETPSGGINKDSSNPLLSPHHYLHRTAAWAAIKATEKFFTHEKYGIFKNMTHKQIQGLFNIRLTRGSLVFVIDITDSMKQEIDAVKDKTMQIVEKTKGKRNAPTSFILSTFSDPERMTEVRQTNDANEMIQWLQELKVASGGDCEEYALSGLEQAIERATPESQVYLFTDAPPKEPAKFESVLTKAIKKRIRITPILSGGCGSRRRGKRDVSDEDDDYDFNKINSWYKIFDQLADKTGSQVYVTDETELENTLTVLEENLVEYPVEIMRSTLHPRGRRSLDIYIDENLWDLRIKIDTAEGDFSARFYDPDGRDVLEQPNGYLVKLTKTMFLIKIDKPLKGNWRLERTTNEQKPKRWLVKVTAQSVVDFSVNLYDNEDGVKFEISGRPIAGTKITAQVRVPKIKLIEKLDEIILYDKHGNTLLEASLKQGKHRRNQNFRGKFVIPSKTFYIGVKGTDKQGNSFTRLKFIPYIPSSMKLVVTPIPVISYPRMNLKIKFMVSNEGSKTERILVFMSEALQYTVTNSRQRFDIGAGQNITGHFNVIMRDAIGKNVVITITSEIEGGNRRSSTQYDTVETTILEKREIIKLPVKQNPPLCNFEITVSSTEECIKSFQNFSCCRHQWTAVINAEASSDFSPIVNLVSSMSSKISSNQDISAGVVGYRANISNDCCTDRDTVYVRDTKNQIGKCFLMVVPPFVSFNSTCKKLPPKKVPLVCNLYTTMKNSRRCVDSHKDFNCCRKKWSAILLVENGSNPAPIVNVTSSMSSLIVANENLRDSAFVYEAEISNDCCVVTDTIYVVDAKNQTGKCTLHVIPDSSSINPVCKKLPPKKVPLVCNLYTNMKNSRRCVNSLKNFNCCRKKWSAILQVENGSNPAPVVSVTSSMSSLIVANEELRDSAFVYEAEISNDCCVITDTIYVVDAKNQTGKCSLHVIPDSSSINSTCKKLPPKKVPLVCNLYTTMKNRRRCVDSHKDFNCCRKKWSAILQVEYGSNPAPIVNVTSSMSSVIVPNEDLTDMAFVYEAEISNDCCVITDTIYVIDAKNQTGKCSLHVIPDSPSINSTCKPLKKEFQSYDNQPNLLHNSVTLSLCLLLISIIYQI